MLAQAIGDILTFAVGVTISPLPIVGVVLMLATAKGRANGLAFLAGWIVGLVVACTLVVFVVGDSASADSGGPETWASVLKLVLGGLLILVAFKQLKARPRGDAEPPMPKWMQAIDTFTPGKSAAFGFVMAAVNPKNLLMVVAAGVSIAGAGLSSADELIVIAVFLVIATAGPAIPVGIYFSAGARAPEILAGLRAWLAHNNAVIMAVLVFVIGTKLIGQGIAGLG